MKDIKVIKNQICAELFEDTYNNINLLLGQIVNAYNNGTIEKRPQYKDLVTIYTALNSDDVSVLKTLKKYEGQNFNAVLYDAYKDGLTKTFDDIKSQCYKFDKKDLDQNLINQAGVQVYNIKKLPKKMLVNVSRMERENISKNTKLDKELDEFIYGRSYRDINQDYKSLSFVDNHDLKVYRNINDYVTFIYPSNIDNDLLITITKSDAWIDFKNKNVNVGVAPNFVSAKTLLDSTNEFNEIAVLRNDPHSNREVKPVGLFCNKKITEYEKQIANKLNIPIIYSETDFMQKKYSKKSNFYNYQDKNKIKNRFDEFQK